MQALWRSSNNLLRIFLHPRGRHCVRLRLCTHFCLQVAPLFHRHRLRRVAVTRWEYHLQVLRSAHSECNLHHYRFVVLMVCFCLIVVVAAVAVAVVFVVVDVVVLLLRFFVSFVVNCQLFVCRMRSLSCHYFRFSVGDSSFRSKAIGARKHASFIASLRPDFVLGCKTHQHLCEYMVMFLHQAHEDGSSQRHRMCTLV